MKTKRLRSRNIDKLIAKGQHWEAKGWTVLHHIEVGGCFPFGVWFVLTMKHEEGVHEDPIHRGLARPPA